MLALAAGLLAAAPAAARETGLPVPRFVSIRAETVNLRAGPGRQYPIKWVVTRPGLPVEITQEYDVWRRIRDADGTVGWVHQSMLSGKRTVLVAGVQRELRRRAEDGAPAVARVDPKVIGRLMECDPRWCRVEVAGVRGWLKRGEIWGLYPDEKIE